MRVLLGLLIWTLAEISAFVVVGGWIGLAGVLALVVGSAVAGVAILRRQGGALGAARGGRDALRAAGQAGMLALAGVLLILPGLITDVAGLVLLLPPVRSWVIGRLGERVVQAGAARGEVVEATAIEVEPGPMADEGREPSGWTKP